VPGPKTDHKAIQRRSARGRAALAAGLAWSVAALSSHCSGQDVGFDPLERARASIGRIQNAEATVPPMCYTETHGRFNPCWTCHTASTPPNHMQDWSLQRRYEFSDLGRTNRWSNLFADFTKDVLAIADEEIALYVRADNYEPLRAALAGRRDFEGYRPDLDLERGFDAGGFARDGSGWRALRYRPFPGTFWPTNGSADDVFVRLPRKFGCEPSGTPSRAVALRNFDILESAIKQAPDLPQAYAGAAGDVLVRTGLYPLGVEFLHSVRYLDPAAPSLMARRMKELRYAKKVRELDDWAIVRAYEREIDERGDGRLPQFGGTPLSGLENAFGWRLQGYIENANGRLRLQTEEEHLACMGCHSHLGVTVDHTFSLARKLPGPDGWRPQDLRGQRDLPQAGHAEPEVLEYLRRAGGGDELRANDEMLARWFKNGRVDSDRVRAAGARPDGLLELTSPSPARAWALNKAYLAIVRRQSFALGRDGLLTPATNVRLQIGEDDAAFPDLSSVYRDGGLAMSW
jgi:hypothetical protein